MGMVATLFAALLPCLPVQTLASSAPEARAKSDAMTGTFRFEPSPLEAEVPALYRLEAAEVSFEMTTRQDAPDLRISSVRFASPLVTPHPENNTVHAEYFEPLVPPPAGSQARPGVVVLHILGADFALSRFLCLRLARAGIAALFVKLPYYGERRPAGDPNARFLSSDFERSMTSMRQGVCDVRRGLAWLASQPGIDPERLGVTGISLGGIVSALVAEMEPRLDRACLLLAGGDLTHVFWTSPDTEPYRERWIQAGKSRADFQAFVAPYDPLTHAERLKNRKILMMAGRIDEVIPPECTTRLWEAAGKPPITWFDCGHYSAAAYLLPATRQMVDFFAQP
jgi:dienelactone hydrolase